MAAWPHIQLGDRGGQAMGVVLPFPPWRVVARAEGAGPGEPQALTDPAGRRHAVLAVLRRRLVAAAAPDAPLRHETEVRTAAGDFLLCWTDAGAEWEVTPLRR